MGLYDIAYVLSGTAQIEADTKEQAIAMLEESLDLDHPGDLAVVSIDEVA